MPGCNARRGERRMARAMQVSCNAAMRAALVLPCGPTQLPRWCEQALEQRRSNGRRRRRARLEERRTSGWRGADQRRWRCGGNDHSRWRQRRGRRRRRLQRMVDQRAVAGAVAAEPVRPPRSAGLGSIPFGSRRRSADHRRPAPCMHDPVERAKRLTEQQRRDQPPQPPARNRNGWLDRQGATHRAILPQRRLRAFGPLCGWLRSGSQRWPGARPAKG